MLTNRTAKDSNDNLFDGMNSIDWIFLTATKGKRRQAK
jgi:hypothetical protein